MANATPGDAFNRTDWLAQRVERPLDAMTPIIDAHHHLWDFPGSRFLADDLHACTRGSHNVTHTVFVECLHAYDDGPGPFRPVGETRAVVAEARRLQSLGSARLGAIVGHADLTLGAAVGEVLDAHLDAGEGLFRGVRHATNWSSDPAIPPGHHKATAGLLLTAEFAASARELARRDLSFDAWLYHDQLAELVQFATAVPDLTVVLNHLGGPLGVGGYADHPASARDVWRDGMSAAASCPNIVVKVGGLGLGLLGVDWSTHDVPPSSEEVATHWKPWVDTVVELFGPERILFESNFPVDRQNMSYPVLWNAFQRLAAPYAPAERDSMFANTAARVYRIDLT